MSAMKHSAHPSWATYWIPIEIALTIKNIKCLIFLFSSWQNVQHCTSAYSDFHFIHFKTLFIHSLQNFNLFISKLFNSCLPKSYSTHFKQICFHSREIIIPLISKHFLFINLSKHFLVSSATTVLHSWTLPQPSLATRH
jgi:hypothetical protein